MSEKNQVVKVRQPWIRIVKRDELVWWKRWLIRLACVVGGLLVSALFIYGITHLNPLDVYISMFKGALGTTNRIWVTLKDLALLLCISVALAPAFKMRFWNCGAEGQVLIGGLVTAALMINFGDKLPNGLLLAIMVIASILAGAIWGFIPAVFKAKYRTNETLFTLMMNYVALQLVEFFIDIWDKKQSHSVGIINAANHGGWMDYLFGQQYLWLIIIVLLITVGMYFYLKYSKHGYEIAVVGESENTARYAGINVSKVIIRTMLVSGAFSGLAGFLEVSAVSHTISALTAGGRGFTAIIVAWLAKFNTLVMVLITFLIVFLDRGATQIASDFNLNKHASSIITGIILFFVLASEFFINYQLVFRSRKKEGE